MIKTLIGLNIVIAYLFYKLKRNWLQSFTILNMLFVPIFGAKMIEIFGLTSNIGTVFYSFAVLGFALIIFRYGRRVAYETLVRVLGLFGIVFTTLFIMHMLPVIPGNEDASSAFSLLYETRESIVMASYMALVISIIVFITVVRYAKAHKFPTLGYALAIPVVQVIDSAVFFPIAFHDYSGNLFELAYEGTIIKILIGLLTVPLMYLLTSDHFVKEH